MTLVTIYQANNPETLPVMINEPELVLESELPERLSGINSRVDTLESKTDKISRDGDQTIIPNILTADVGIRNNGPDSNLRVCSIEGQAIMNIWNSTKLVECHGALTANNVTSTNKTDIENLQTKTQNINASGTTLSNITTINGRKIGVPHGWNFVYWDYAPYIPVCNAFNGSMTIGHTIIFKDEYGEDYAGAILMCNARGQLEIMGRFSADMYKTDVGFALRQYKNTSMKFMKYDDTTSMLTLNSLDDTATFLGNVVAPNITSLENKLAYIDADEFNIYLNSTVRFTRMKIQSGSTVIVDHNESPIMEIFNDKLVEFFGPLRCNWLDTQLAHMRAITYDEEGNKTIIANTTETGNLKVTYETETYTLTVGSHATFSGTAFFSSTVNGYSLDT